MQRNGLVDLSVATAVHYACATLREQVWMELQAQEGLAMVLQAANVMLETGADDHLEQLVIALEELLSCEVSGLFFVCMRNLEHSVDDAGMHAFRRDS